ncbi:hypothetical protein Ciccas_004751 [Cichlidogyrus casuarinus]|uniref:Uncharacterized protein n=1 Tax=Cichlidogyrus casuarinus TaxID=1844966 RepID=A0ABD2QAM7_9PLAT
MKWSVIVLITGVLAFAVAAERDNYLDSLNEKKDENLEIHCIENFNYYYSMMDVANNAEEYRKYLKTGQQTRRDNQQSQQRMGDKNKHVIDAVRKMGDHNKNSQLKNSKRQNEQGQKGTKPEYRESEPDFSFKDFDFDGQELKIKNNGKKPGNQRGLEGRKPGKQEHDFNKFNGEHNGQKHGSPTSGNDVKRENRKDQNGKLKEDAARRPKESQGVAKGIKAEQRGDKQNKAKKERPNHGFEEFEFEEEQYGFSNKKQEHKKNHHSDKELQGRKPGNTKSSHERKPSKESPGKGGLNDKQREGISNGKLPKGKSNELRGVANVRKAEQRGDKQNKAKKERPNHGFEEFEFDGEAYDFPNKKPEHKNNQARKPENSKSSDKQRKEKDSRERKPIRGSSGEKGQDEKQRKEFRDAKLSEGKWIDQKLSEMSKGRKPEQKRQTPGKAVSDHDKQRKERHGEMSKKRPEEKIEGEWVDQHSDKKSQKRKSDQKGAEHKNGKDEHKDVRSDKKRPDGKWDNGNKDGKGDKHKKDKEPGFKEFEFDGDELHFVKEIPEKHGKPSKGNKNNQPVKGKISMDEFNRYLEAEFGKEASKAFKDNRHNEKQKRDGKDGGSKKRQNESHNDKPNRNEKGKRDNKSKDNGPKEDKKSKQINLGQFKDMRNRDEKGKKQEMNGIDRNEKRPNNKQSEKENKNSKDVGPKGINLGKDAERSKKPRDQDRDEKARKLTDLGKHKQGKDVERRDNKRDEQSERMRQKDKDNKQKLGPRGDKVRKPMDLVKEERGKHDISSYRGERDNNRSKVHGVSSKESMHPEVEAIKPENKKHFNEIIEQVRETRKYRKQFIRSVLRENEHLQKQIDEMRERLRHCEAYRAKLRDHMMHAIGRHNSASIPTSATLTGVITIIVMVLARFQIWN